MKKHQIFSNAYLIIFIILVAAYLPIVSLHFGLKNDTYSDNFPNKYFLTEALRSGFLPTWNPYLNFGFPVYADPGFAFWSPVTWLFGGIIGYNVYTHTIEILLYIYLAGIFMYQLLRSFKIEKTVAISGAAMYMCSGFFCGEMQHVNYLAAAAFLPFTIQCLFRLTREANLRNAVYAAFGYYTVAMAGHPAMSIGLAYFLFVVCLASLLLSDTNHKKMIMASLRYHLFAVIIVILLFLPALYSYFSLFPEFARSKPLDQSGETTLGFSISSFLSFLVPFSTANGDHFFTDDYAMRNGYFSMTGILLLPMAFRRAGIAVKCLLIAGLAMLVLSAGGQIKYLLYTYLPGLNLLRTNGQFRVFSICSFCIGASVVIQSHVQPEQLAKLLKTFRYLFIAVLLFILVFMFRQLPGWIEKGRHFSVDNTSFGLAALVGIIVQVLLISIFLAGKKTIRRIANFIVLDVVINCLLYLPVTGIGRTTLKEIHSWYNVYPKGIVIPPMQAINSIDTFDAIGNGLLGSAFYYNKKIGAGSRSSYPSMLFTTDSFFNSPLKKAVMQKPFVFFANGDNSAARLNDAIAVKSFSPVTMQFNINVSKEDTLVLLQNYYRYWGATIDGRTATIQRTMTSFMGVPVQAGMHTVTFFYKDKWLGRTCLFSLFILLSVITYLFITRSKFPLRGD